MDPHQAEVNQYFFGLARGGVIPKLVARSSQEPFSPKRDSTFLSRKMIFNVGQHSIVQAYDNGPRTEIRNALRDLQWFKIDIIRIGYSYVARENPVVVLVTVEPGSVSYRKGQEAIQKCREILQNYNLDVHVEMKEGKKSARFVDIDCVSPPAAPYQRIPCVGQSIGPSVDSKNQASGTLGLYVTIKHNSTSKRCALTCHQVAFPETVRDPVDGFGKPFRRLLILINFGIHEPSTQDHNALQDNLRDMKEFAVDRLANLIKQQSEAEEDPCKPLTQHQLEMIDIFQSRIQNDNEVLEQTSQFSRVFGKVLSSSGITTGPEHNNLLNWALIGLDKNRFNQRPENFLPKFDFSSQYLREMNDNLYGKGIFDPKDASTCLTAYVKLQEALKPTTMDKDGFQTFRVMKHGRSSGWTAGISNEIWSDCQRYPGRVSTEWCILDLPHSTPFSGRGDLGSVVFDYRGRVVGFLHGGGSPVSSGLDVTYITPIEWVFDNIEKTLGVSIVLD